MGRLNVFGMSKIKESVLRAFKEAYFRTNFGFKQDPAAYLIIRFRMVMMR